MSKTQNIRPSRDAGLFDEFLQTGRLIVASDFPPPEVSEKYMTYMNEDTLEVYEYDGLQWVSKTSISDSVSLELDNLTNVDTSGVTPGQVLKYNGIAWENQNDTVGSGTVTSVNNVLPDGLGNVINKLENLNDAVIVTPVADEVLRYDGVNWKNQLNNKMKDLSDTWEVSTPTLTNADTFVCEDKSATLINKSLGQDTKLQNDAGTFYQELNLELLTNNHILTVPNNTGTLALVSDLPLIGVGVGEVLDNESLILANSILITDSVTSKQKSLTSAPGGMMRFNKTTADPETFTANTGELMIYDNGWGALATAPNNWMIASNGVGVAPTYQDIASKAETLTNKSINGFDNTLTNVMENVIINRVAKSGPVFLPNLYVGAFVDNQPVVLNDKVLLTKQFTASEQGLYLVNSAPNPPTRLDDLYNSSRKRYICDGGDLYTNSIWMCNNETGLDVGGTDTLQFRRVDNDAKLYGGLYQNVATYSQTMNATINTYDQLLCFDTASPTSGSVSINTIADTITLPSTEQKVYELQYNLSWDSITGGAKEFTIGIFVDGVLCRQSESSRSLPNNLLGETSGSCNMMIPANTSPVIDLRAKSDTSSVNIRINSGHLRVKEIS